MPGHVIGKTLARGFAGTISRSVDAIVQPLRNMDTGAIAFGAPVSLKSDGTGVLNFASTHTAGDFVGVAVREVKTETAYGSAEARYEAGELVDVLTRGSIAVKCLRDSTATSAPVRGGSVYIRKSNGAFVAAAEGTNGADTVELTNVKWAQNGCDADGTAEIVILERKG